jgi:Protein of unknown function (DUF669)
MGLLDLSGADTSGFDAMPAGIYDAEVYEITMKETKGGETSKLPAGTPMLNVQFRITDEEYENRRQFKTYVIAPEKIGGKKYEHKAKMDGILARFFIAIGCDEEEVTSGQFEPDFEELKGNPCRITLKQREYNGELQNEVTGVRPIGDEVTAGPGLL